ncbi:hypothetical protein RB195_015868 [Necator americanus]|uniref:Reverse transcriptase domain-containing protein n=1 Tax=Necator americanus TaxID=51031 RepID=A0ABR1E6K4_NECAM
MRKLEWDDMGVKVDGRQLHHLRFADDIVLITPNISQAERMLTEFDETCACIGLQLNLQKTMFTGHWRQRMGNGWVSDAPFRLNGTNMSECTSYVCLGRELKMMNDLTPELGRRRRPVRGAYKSIEDVVKKTRNIRLHSHLFNTTVLPALTYASETWAFRKQEENAEDRRLDSQITSRSPSKKIMMLFVSHAKGRTTGLLWYAIGQMEELLASARPVLRSTGVKPFKCGNKRLEDEPRPGRPTAISFDELKNLAEQHLYEGVRYFAASRGCSLSTVSNGPRSLGMVKKLGQWLPHALSDGNRERRLDICTKLLSRSRRFDWLTPLSLEMKNESSTSTTPTNVRGALAVNTDPFVKGEIHEKKVMLSVRLAVKISKKHPKLDNVRLLHDNARPHIAKKTSEKILGLGWKVLPYPPYSTDLAPCDHHLFLSLQLHLEEKRYDGRDHLKNDLRAFFASKSPEFYAKESVIL